MNLLKNLFFVALALVVCNSREFNVSCGSCQTKCQSDNVCYTLSGYKFLKEICTQRKQCPFVGMIKYTSYTCEKDFNNKICPNKICGTVHGLEKCLDPIDHQKSNRQDICEKGQFSYQCSQCLHSNCQSCLTTNSSTTCVDRIYPKCKWSVEMINGTCSEGKDSFGRQCDCCQISNVTGNIGFCSDEDIVLSSVDSNQQFKDWISAFDGLLATSIIVSLILLILS